jgi:hypothetical protein
LTEEKAMSNTNQRLTPHVLAFVEKVKADTAKASRILWETRTLSASQTFQNGLR